MLSLTLLTYSGVVSSLAFINLFQFLFLSSNLLFHFVSSLLQTGLILEHIVVVLHRDGLTLSESAFCELTRSLHKKAPVNAPISTDF